MKNNSSLPQISHHPRFKFGGFVLADVYSFGDFYIEGDQQAAVEPDCDVRYTLASDNVLLIGTNKVGRIQGRYNLFQRPGVGIGGAIFHKNTGILIGSVKAGYIPQIDGYQPVFHWDQ